MKKLLIFISFIFTMSMYTVYSQKAYMEIPDEDLAGTFVREDGMASIELILKSQNQFYIEGAAISSRGGSIGELNYVVQYYDYEDTMKYEANGYTLTINVLDENTLYITEEGDNELSGMGVSFNGTYNRE